MKNAIGEGSVKTLVDDIKLAEVLVLDDIGAEQSTPWVRDEILQVILQYRMQEGCRPSLLPTLISKIWKNILPKEKNGNDETWEARWVMERIRYLAEETRLEGE